MSGRSTGAARVCLAWRPRVATPVGTKKGFILRLLTRRPGVERSWWLWFKSDASLVEGKRNISEHQPTSTCGQQRVIRSVMKALTCLQQFDNIVTWTWGVWLV